MVTEINNGLFASDESETDILTLVCDESQAGERIDRFITNATDQSRSLIVKLIESEFVTVNGNKVEKN